ncbi:MAG: CHAD domain-containing protein [Xenococcaceae cyanobacterium MO_188.B29]|nr:CHAD domain-containing protein [Xenococcaceae cyanobacterium MO_188.B29]
MSQKDNAVTLGEWASIAIAKHTRKMLKYEARVIQDKDPEDLHQMRVGMRRLRSAIAGFAIALDLPKTVNEKNIAKIGRSLGKLRDLDVLLATLANYYRSQLPKGEQKSLDKVIKSLNKQRKKELKQVRETLNSKLYLNLQQGLQDWLEKPKCQAIGNCSIYPVLPDLLLPQISQLLLHPGWLVGVELKEDKIQIPEMLKEEEIEQLLEQEESLLHDLRKQAKKTRYNLELFSRFYDDTYHYYVKQIEQIQEVLGQIQDCYVLREVLEKVLNSAIAEKMPELATLLTKTRYQKWQEWSILQEEFLDDKTRQELRQTIQQPLTSQESEVN